MNPHTLLAQRRGGRSAGPSPSSNGVPSTDDLKDFKRAVAVQATPDQVIRFQRLTKSTQIAREGTEHLVHLADNGSEPDLFRSISPLISAVEEARTGDENFLQSFSAVQKSELKVLTKKLRKADSDVTSRSNALARDLERSRMTGSRISAVTRKLDQALRDFQAKQLALGIQMGIPNEQNPQ
ncbi:MAG: hypothetical protein JWO91_3702 [Acidobacteriaceae bacterium]|nr:hypothetical protein [Acidobacteriaceae bacterium]